MRFEEPVDHDLAPDGLSSDEGRRILICGLVRDVFLAPILRAASDRGNCTFDTWDLVDVSDRRVIHDVKGISNNLNAPQVQAENFALVQNSVGTELVHVSTGGLVAEYSGETASALQEDNRLLCDLLRYTRQVAVEGYDVVNLHWAADPLWLDFAQACPSSVGLVVSFWGSDLHTCAGPEIYAAQYRALHRADLITCHSPELEQLIRMKFGHDLAPKIRQALFGVDESILDLIDGVIEEEGSVALAAPLGLPNKLRVVCGYSGSRVHQHVAVIRALSRLSRSVRDLIHVVLPMTYNTGDLDYQRDVERALAESGLDGRILRDPMSPADVARLRAATDVFVSVPVMDAFSSSMVESLYGGAVLVTGNWLPYGKLRRARLPLYEVFAVEELEALLPAVLESASAAKETARSRKQRPWQKWIRENVASATQGAVWDDIFVEAARLAADRGLAEKGARP